MRFELFYELTQPQMLHWLLWFLQLSVFIWLWLCDLQKSEGWLKSSAHSVTTFEASFCFQKANITVWSLSPRFTLPSADVLWFIIAAHQRVCLFVFSDRVRLLSLGTLDVVETVCIGDIVELYNPMLTLNESDPRNDQTWLEFRGQSGVTLAVTADRFLHARLTQWTGHTVAGEKFVWV